MAFLKFTFFKHLSCSSTYMRLSHFLMASVLAALESLIMARLEKDNAGLSDQLDFGITL